MSRQSIVTVLAVVIAFVMGACFFGRPSGALAQPRAGQRGKCVGISAFVPAPGAGNPLIVIYRAFEDGSVDVSEGTVADRSVTWKPLSPK